MSVSLPRTREFEALARRIIWFEAPEQSLADIPRFLAYALRYAQPLDMAAIRAVVGDEYILKTLDHLPPGIVDPRSWAYWNSKLGRWPAPPAPQRRL
jgi:hypothetical protein